MSARPNHKQAIVQAAMTLFRRRGYASTGLNDIVELSGAPKGSLYYYFPKGKASIAEAAVRASSQNVARTLDDLAQSHPRPGALVRAYGKTVAGWMRQSAFRSGSPITTVLLETAPDDPEVTLAGREAFAAWRSTIAQRLVADGVAEARAGRLARLAVSAIEGALIQARVECSEAPIDEVAAELEAILEAAGPGKTRRR